MQRTGLYIGYLNQQQHVSHDLETKLKKGNSGIFLVTGGIRVGKTTILRQLANKIGISYFLPSYTEDYDLTLREYNDVLRFNKTDPRNIIVPTTEILVSSSPFLHALHDIVESEIKKGNKIRVIGEVMTKKFPAWNSKANNKYITDEFSKILQPKLLHFFPLDCDQNRLAEGVWTMIQTEERGVWTSTVEELGFPPSYSEFWRTQPQSKNLFVESVVKVMKKYPLGNLEGQRKGGEKF